MKIFFWWAFNGALVGLGVQLFWFSWTHPDLTEMQVLQSIASWSWTAFAPVAAGTFGGSVAFWARRMILSGRPRAISFGRVDLTKTRLTSRDGKVRR